MKKNFPLWYKLIYHWCRKRKPTGFGLTIPFLIGAERNMSISQFMTEVSNSEYGEPIILQRCAELNEYVLSLDDRSNPFAKHLDGVKSLCFYDEENSSKTLDEVIKSLEEMYSDIVETKTYSKDKLSKEWREYTKEDIKLINEVRSSGDLSI